MAQAKNQDSSKSNKKKRRKRGKQQNTKDVSILEPIHKGQKKKRTLPVIPPIEVPTVEEPLPICALCSKPIKGIAQALSGPADGQLSHFDCVLEKIAEDEKPLPHQKISYIGRGMFAIVDKDEEGKLLFTKRITWETAERFDAMKKLVEGTKK